MSQAISVFWVPRDELLFAPGCGDQELLDNIVEQMADDIAEVDDLFKTADSDVWAGPTATEALAALIENRTEYDPELEEMYTAVYETLCSYYGDFAGNDHFSPCRLVWLARIDELFVSGGVQLSLADLWTAGPPGAGPLNRVVSAGYWEAARMRAAVEPLARVIPGTVDKEERAALDQVMNWLKFAERDPDGVLVGFFG